MVWIPQIGDFTKSNQQLRCTPSKIHMSPSNSHQKDHMKRNMFKLGDPKPHPRNTNVSPKKGEPFQKERNMVSKSQHISGDKSGCFRLGECHFLQN